VRDPMHMNLSLSALLLASTTYILQERIKKVGGMESFI
jgi:hypothetical protein